ncbi:MAG: hypothetical protein AB7G47_19825 [Mycolicibacterium sp.]|uniref:hypothetical protein n=1 Tax=Mycolicibacterium sp. TaxID=2320850 RepID=UPI003D0D6606
MDISEMMVGGGNSAPIPEGPQDFVSPQNLDADIAVAVPAAGIEAELSAVERIRAYRDGTLQPPMVGVLSNGDDDPNSGGDDSAMDVTGGSGNDEADPMAGVGVDDALADADASGNAPDPAGGDGGSAGGARRRMPRRAILVGVPAVVGLAALGVLIPGRGGHGAQQQADIVVQAAAGGDSQQPNTSAPPIAPIDAVIHPANVEAPEYPISVTPPADAFTTEKGTGWICAGLDGTVMTITLPAPMVISEIDVLPGIDGPDKDGSDQWAKHRIVTRVAFNLDYGDPVYGEFPDPNKRALQPTPMNNTITRTIRLVVLETKDASAKGPTVDAGTSPTAAVPGLLGDLGPLTVGQGQGAADAGDGARPATFAIGSIQIMGHAPA